MTQNDNKEVQYIWHDGVRIREDQLISMALNAGDYGIAEHYVCSLLAHGVIHGLAYIIDKANEIREFYQVGAIPKPNMDVDNMPRPKTESIDIRRVYMMMESDERKQVISLSLTILYENHPKLFKSKNDWIGIYLVIRDRVNGNLSKSEFAEVLIDVIPKWWPSRLLIGSYTMSNFSRCLDCNDRLEAYYDMDNNPWDELCNTFWEILKQQIMTNK